jgi:hypothetical protein
MDHSEMARIERAQLDTLVREAQVERNNQLKEAIVAWAKAVARFLRVVGDSIREAYEAERIRSSSQAESAMRRWQGKY